MDVTKNCNRLPVISFFSTLFFCLYFATVSHFDILPWFGTYNEKRILELLLLLVVTSLFICNSTSRENWLSTLGHLPGSSKVLLLSIAGLGLISSAGAAFPKFALLEVSLFILLFAGSICVASCYIQLGDLFGKMIAIALFLTGWFYLAGFAGYYLTALSGDITLSQPDLFGNFGNIRFFNQFQSWTLSLLVIPSLIFPKRSFFIKALFITVAIGWWLLLFTSNCRGTLVGCLIAFFITLLLFGKQAKLWFQWQVVAIAGGLAAYLLFFFLIPKIMSVDVQTIIDRDIIHDTPRIELWSSAGKMVQTQPWLGAGPMHFAAETRGNANHPHNSLLQIAAEWGLPVALTVIALFAWGLLTWFKTIKSIPSTLQNQNVYVALFASLLTAAVHSLFCGIIVMPLSQVMMTLVIGWMLGISARHSVARENHHKLKHFILWLIFLVTISGVIWPLFPELLYLEELQTEFLHSHPEKGYLKPRFWELGDLNEYKPMPLP